MTPRRHLPWSLPVVLLGSLLLPGHAEAGAGAGAGDDAAIVENVADVDSGWVVVARARSPDDISLWTRHIAGAELKAFRGATELELPVEGLLAFLDDVPRMTKWLFRCRQAKIITRLDDGVVYIYLQIEGIWPVEDRDAVVKVVPEYTAATGTIRLVGTAAPDYLPPSEGYVRVPSLETTWLMRPAGEGRIYVEWSGHVDPGGKVPRWLSNVLAPLVPRHTLQHLREETAQPLWLHPAQREHGAEMLARFRKLPH